MLLHNASALWIAEKKATLPHSDAALRLFAFRTIGTGEVVGVVYYFDFLVYSNPTRKWQMAKAFREGAMQMVARTFWMWANELLEMVIDKDEVEYKVSLVPALFCTMQYMNDAKYLPRDTTRETGRRLEPRDNSLPFCNLNHRYGLELWLLFRSLSVQALCNIALGEELRGRYVLNYALFE